MTKRREITQWLPLAILAIATALLFYPLIFGRALFWGLPSLQFYPWRQFAFDEIREGRIPFWNPYVGGGAPLIANYQSAIFYPPNWLHLFLSNYYAMGLIAILHVFWAGLGMWLFTGHLGFAPLGRGVSVLSFALGNYCIARFGSFPTTDAAAWIPWMFWITLRILEQRRLRDIGLMGMITGMQLLAGHAQTTWYGLVALGLFALWYTRWPARPTAPKLRFLALLLCGIALVLGLGVAAIQLVLTQELLSQSQRSGGVDYKVLTNLSYAPARIFTMFTPRFFGTPADGSYLTKGRGVYFEDTAYIGFLPLISAIAAMIGWFQRRKLLKHHPIFRSVPFWSLLSLAGLLLATGRFGPFYPFLYNHVPTFDNFREPVRWLIWPAFGLSILAGIGAHGWGRSPRVIFWTRLSAAAGGGIVVVSLLSALFLQTADSEALQVLVRAMVALGVVIFISAILTLTQPPTGLASSSLARWQIAVLIFIAGDLIWSALGLNPTVSRDFYQRDFSISKPIGRLYWFEDYEKKVKFDDYFDLDDYRVATRRWLSARTSLLPNLNMLDDIAIFNNFDPLEPDAHVRYIELIEDAGPNSGKLLWAAGVGQTYGETQPRGWQGEGTEFITPLEPSTVWMVPNAIPVANQTEATQQLLNRDWSPDQTVIIEAADFEPITDASFTEAEVEVLSERPNERRYRVTSDGAGYLVLASTWYPGWEVEIDGQEATLYQANLTFQAIEIPAGGADVTLRYRPNGFGAGVLVTFIAVLLCLMLIAIGLFRAPTEN
ncbi:MAG: YfhO family protein [Chloroflexi bacterium]|nr:YfhO family protein [Chloroflexota bacterium]